MENPALYDPAEIVRRFRAGDTHAFAFIFHQFYFPVCFFAKKLVEKPQAAEDIVEETFISCWRNHEQFNDLLAIKSYLYSTTRDACFSFINQQQKRIRDKGISDYMITQAESYIQKVLSREEGFRELGYNPIENLPPLCKQLVMQAITAMA